MTLDIINQTSTSVFFRTAASGTADYWVVGSGLTHRFDTPELTNVFWGPALGTATNSLSTPAMGTVDNMVRVFNRTSINGNVTIVTYTAGWDPVTIFVLGVAMALTWCFLAWAYTFFGMLNEPLHTE